MKIFSLRSRLFHACFFREKNVPGFPTLNACTAAMCECIIFQLLSVHRIMCTNKNIFQNN